MLPVGMICRATRTVNGVKIYARDYGLRAFCWFPNRDVLEINQQKKTTLIKE